MSKPFHYQRTPSEEGGVARVDGAPVGTRLDGILRQGLAPVRVGLELVAAFCEIIYIAHDDREVNGDLQLSDVWLTGDGVVSIGGFGLDRHHTAAPERTVRGQASDLYGLGRVAAAVLTEGHEVLDRLPRSSANDHDDAVADFVMSADLGELDETTLNDIRWFLLYLMSFDHKERPDALRAWRSFIAFARTIDGPDLATWAEAALRGRAERRRAAEPGRATERLDDATTRAGPLATKMTFASSGGRTLFWTPEEDDEAVSEPEVGSSAGRGQGHWSIRELSAMAKDTADAPRPNRVTSPTPAAAPPPPPEPAPAGPTVTQRLPTYEPPGHPHQAHQASPPARNAPEPSPPRQAPPPPQFEETTWRPDSRPTPAPQAGQAFPPPAPRAPVWTGHQSPVNPPVAVASPVVNAPPAAPVYHLEDEPAHTEDILERTGLGNMSNTALLVLGIGVGAVIIALFVLAVMILYAAIQPTAAMVWI